MAGVNEFIQNFLGLQRNQIAQQQADVQEQATNAQISLQGISGFIDALRATDNPIEQRAMAEVLARRGVAPLGVFESLMRNVGPSTETQKARSVQRGTTSMQGKGAATTPGADLLDREAAATAFTQRSVMELETSKFLADLINTADADPEKGDLARALKVRLAAGQTLGDYDLSVNLSNLPQSVREQRARVTAEVTPSATQAAAIEQARANQRTNDRQLDLQGVIAGMNFQTETDKNKKSLLAQLNPEQLMNTKRQIYETLSTKKEGMTRDAVNGYIGTLNGINQMLEAAGIWNEGQYQYDPDKLLEPGIWKSIMNRLNSGTALVPGTRSGGVGGRVGPGTLQNPTLRGPAIDSSSRTKTTVNIPGAAGVIVNPDGSITIPGMNSRPLTRDSSYNSLGVKR